MWPRGYAGLEPISKRLNMLLSGLGRGQKQELIWRGVPETLFWNALGTAQNPLRNKWNPRETHSQQSCETPWEIEGDSV